MLQGKWWVEFFVFLFFGNYVMIGCGIKEGRKDQRETWEQIAARRFLFSFFFSLDSFVMKGVEGLVKVGINVS
jgi:hypothetical protein